MRKKERKEKKTMHGALFTPRIHSVARELSTRRDEESWQGSMATKASYMIIIIVVRCNLRMYLSDTAERGRHAPRAILKNARNNQVPELPFLPSYPSPFTDPQSLEARIVRCGSPGLLQGRREAFLAFGRITSACEVRLMNSRLAKGSSIPYDSHTRQSLIALRVSSGDFNVTVAERSGAARRLEAENSRRRAARSRFASLSSARHSSWSSRRGLGTSSRGQESRAEKPQTGYHPRAPVRARVCVCVYAWMVASGDSARPSATAGLSFTQKSKIR